MFDMLAYANLNTQMSDITTSLQSIFTFCDSPYSLTKDPSLLKGFIETYYLDDQCKHFLNIMFDCSDKTSRFYSGRLTTIVINKAYQVVKDSLAKGTHQSDRLAELKTLADTLVITLVKSLRTQECMKNWTKLEQYLKILYDVAMDGNSEIYLKKFEIVATLLDVILSQCNSRTSTKLNTFEHLVALICYFIRHSLTP
jgi:hypothetical protein